VDTAILSKIIILLYQQISGQIMQNLLDQYSNQCSQSTPDLINTTAHASHNPLFSEPMTSFFCNQKHVPVTRPSHQKSSLAPISSCALSQKEKKSSELISFSMPRNTNKQSLQHMRFKPKPTFTHI